ncbi:MAG: hypothetical protein ABIJ00_00955 [Candidatus Eisenbacteria bacterium]
MKTIFGCVLVLAVVLGPAASSYILAEEAGSAESPEAAEIRAQEDKDLLSQRKVVASELERRQFRIKWWAAHLTDDMRDVYDEYGYPSSRYREEVMGRLVERWTYVDQGRRFGFKDGQLIEERQFAPGTFKGGISRAVRPEGARSQNPGPVSGEAF